jgi:hypothetical protein
LGDFFTTSSGQPAPQGSHIILSRTYQNVKKYQITRNIPNGSKIYQNEHKIYHLPLHDPPKFTQIWIFGLKICHLATLLLQSIIGAIAACRKIRHEADAVKLKRPPARKNQPPPPPRPSTLVRTPEKRKNASDGSNLMQFYLLNLATKIIKPFKFWYCQSSPEIITITRTQSCDRELQCQRCKNL